MTAYGRGSSLVHRLGENGGDVFALRGEFSRIGATDLPSPAQQLNL